ncbi:exonuclease domain-containing protein [Amycolatopsis sp. NPDC004079]|uniref:exonuclease domain-containing protein n=1 Tax=Amycolatopsis sp. NPDC004079 TaxID=3154549 RepID=UPI00339DB9C2
MPRSPLKLFTPGYLSRHPHGASPEHLTFAALDLETTGLDPLRQRICEIGVVRFRADGTVLDEYSTLVHPRRGITHDAAECNNLTLAELDGAPVFGEVYPDLLRMLQGTVVVAHNLVFEDKFLAAEIGRLGAAPPQLTGVCSMVACRAQLDGPSYKLQSLYRTVAGRWIDGAHTALGDARALAALVPWLAGNCPGGLRYRGPDPVPAPPRSDRPARIFPRAERLHRTEFGYLGALAQRFPRTAEDHPVGEEAAANYADALDDVLRDHQITGDEAWRLEHLARHAGLSQQALTIAHRAAWDRAVRELPLDDPALLTVAQRRKLRSLAHDIGHPELAECLEIPPEDDVPRHLRSWRVGLDGPDGTTSDLRTLVESNSGSIAKRLTKTVRFIAAHDPSAATPQLLKAHELGIPVVTIDDGTKRVADAISAAAAEAARLQHEQAQWAQRRAQLEAADEAYFRHRWRPQETPPVWT